MLVCVLPLVFVSVSTFTANTTTLFRSGIIVLLAFVIYIFKPFDLMKYKLILVIFSIIFAWYTVSFLVTDQSYANFLLGAYGRNFGVLTLLAFMLLMLESAEFYENNKAKLLSSIYVLLIMANIYGAIQNLGIDPLNWETGAGYGLTLGNPNFSSALFGMLSFLPLYYYNLAKDFKKFLHLFMFVSTFIQILLSGSSQGFLLFISNFVLFSIIYNRSKIANNKKKLTIISALVAVSLIFIVVNSFSRIVNLLNSSVQFNSRLEHWRLGYKVFENNWLFGTGVDNLGRFSGEFRNLINRSWGQYTHPDKSHNVVIDYFATGGVVVGLAWLIFVLTISLYALKVLNGFSLNKEDTSSSMIALIWLAYFLQTMFSPDNLVLASIGIICAGALICEYKSKKILEKL